MSTRNLVTFIIVILGITFCACTSESDKWKDLNEKFLQTNKTKDGVVTLKDGLQYKVLTQGVGLIPNSASYVKIVYSGKLMDGPVVTRR